MKETRRFLMPCWELVEGLVTVLLETFTVLVRMGSMASGGEHTCTTCRMIQLDRRVANQPDRIRTRLASNAGGSMPTRLVGVPCVRIAFRASVRVVQGLTTKTPQLQGNALGIKRVGWNHRRRPHWLFGKV